MHHISTGMTLASGRTWIVVAGVAVALYAIKVYCRGGQWSGGGRQDGKIFLVTGANVGIGLETAHEFARRGGTVVMACRDMVKCETARSLIRSKTGSNVVVCMALDLSSFASIKKFTDEFKKRFDRLDVLVNNAGVMMTPFSRTEDGLEVQSGVNHFGHFLLTGLLLDHLKVSGTSRVVVLSSMVHHYGTLDIATVARGDPDTYSATDAYKQSKLANVLFAREAARRLKPHGITVNALHPGVVDTPLWKYVPFINTAVGKLLFSPIRYLIFKSPLDGAQTSLRLALDPTLSTVTGKYFQDCQEEQPSTLAQDDELANKLWSLSEKVTGQSYP